MYYIPQAPQLMDTNVETLPTEHIIDDNDINLDNTVHNPPPLVTDDVDELTLRRSTRPIRKPQRYIQEC